MWLQVLWRVLHCILARLTACTASGPTSQLAWPGDCTPLPLLPCSTHWMGTLDMHGAWTAWLWRMDAGCMLLRTAVTFCAAWASAAPPAALTLHALPLTVLALTTW